MHRQKRDEVKGAPARERAGQGAHRRERRLKSHVMSLSIGLSTIMKSVSVTTTGLVS